MTIYKTLSTSQKLPEFHLYFDNENEGGDSLKNLIEKLESMGYYSKNNDFRLIFERGYKMYESIRFIKSKMRKNQDEILKEIQNWLLTEDIYNNLESTLYYPMINKKFLPYSIV